MHVFLYVYVSVSMCVSENMRNIYTHKLSHTLTHTYTHKHTHTRTQSYCAHISMVKLLFSELQITNIKFCILTTRWVSGVIDRYVLFVEIEFSLKNLKNTSVKIDLN